MSAIEYTQPDAQENPDHRMLIAGNPVTLGLLQDESTDEGLKGESAPNLMFDREVARRVAEEAARRREGVVEPLADPKE